MIRETVAEILQISEKKISLPILTSTSASASSRRVLLSGMFVSYDINVTSYRTPESFKLALTESVSSGNFVTVLKAKSGIEIESTNDLHFDDYSPTSNPTMSPSSVLSSRAGEFTTKVTMIVMILFVY